VLGGAEVTMTRKTLSSIQGDENGYVVAETIGSFIPFVLLVVSILSLVNIVAVQARIHYAMTQTAGTLSMYCYTLELLGIANDLTTLDSKSQRIIKEADEMRGDIDSVISGISSLSNLDDVVDSGENVVNRVLEWGEEIADDPNAVVGQLLSYGINELRNKVFEEMARPLMGRYLANEDMSGNEYLTNAGVINKHTGAQGLNALEFYQFSLFEGGNSTLIDHNGNVKLVATYEIRYTFGGLPLPFNPTLKLNQTVVTKAWLNGSGEGYW